MTEQPVPIPLRRRLWLMVLMHPLELALAVALVINGIRGALGDLPGSLASLPLVPLVGYLVVSTLGGVAAAVGLFLQTALRTVDVGVGMERAAMSLVGTSYLGVAVLVIPTAGVGVAIVSACVGVGVLIRAYAIKLTAAITLDQLRRRPHA